VEKDKSNYKVINKKNKQELKISVHIPFYLAKNNKNKLKLLYKVCNSYLKLSKKTKIFVHSNNKITNKNKKIKFIFHSLKNFHPFRLTWKPRDLMKKQIKDFDIFIFGEDDILFSKKNFYYWLKYKDICIKNDFNLGFLRAEKKGKYLYSVDQIKKLSYIKKIYNKKYIVLENPYCAMWIYDKNEFSKFIKTPYYNFNWKIKEFGSHNFDREMSAVGWHGRDISKGFDMGRYIATIIPLEKNKLDTNSFINHLSNKYSKNPSGLFGSIKIKDLLNKNLYTFIKPNIFEFWFNKIRYNLYSALRINLKDFKKRLNA